MEALPTETPFRGISIRVGIITVPNENVLVANSSLSIVSTDIVPTRYETRVNVGTTVAAYGSTVFLGEDEEVSDGRDVIRAVDRSKGTVTAV